MAFEVEQFLQSIGQLELEFRQCVERSQSETFEARIDHYLLISGYVNSGIELLTA